jgi:hypothetical protein
MARNSSVPFSWQYWVSFKLFCLCFLISACFHPPTVFTVFICLWFYKCCCLYFLISLQRFSAYVFLPLFLLSFSVSNSVSLSLYFSDCVSLPPQVSDYESFFFFSLHFYDSCVLISAFSNPVYNLCMFLTLFPDLCMLHSPIPVLIIHSLIHSFIFIDIRPRPAYLTVNFVWSFFSFCF